MTTGKIIALIRWTFVGKVMSQSKCLNVGKVMLFNMLSRLVIAFLPMSKCLLISWLQSPSAVILEPRPKIKSVTVSIVYPSICHEMMGPDAMISVFWMLSFKPAFSLSSFTFIKRLFSFFSPSAIRMVLSGEGMFLGSVSSQQRFGVMDIKALIASQLLGLRLCYSSQVSNRPCIALRQISVSALCYSSILFRK